MALNAVGIDLSSFGGQNDNVYYVYSEVWGIVGGPIHSMGDFASDNVLFVPNTSGHGMEDLINGMKNGTVRLISLAEVQDRAVAFNVVLDARLIASETGIPFDEVVKHQLIAAIGNDRQLLNSDAFKSMVGELLGDHLTDSEAAHVWGEVVHETNGQCFPAGTLISLANGSQRRIEDIRAEDVVLSFDPATGAHVSGRVARLYRGETEVWLGLTYTQNGVEKSLSTTPKHPFLTKDGSFASMSHLIDAGERWAA